MPKALLPCVHQSRTQIYSFFYRLHHEYTDSVIECDAVVSDGNLGPGRPGCEHNQLTDINRHTIIPTYSNSDKDNLDLLGYFSLFSCTFSLNFC